MDESECKLNVFLYVVLGMYCVRFASYTQLDTLSNINFQEITDLIIINLTHPITNS